MRLSRQEVNLRRLLAKCELMCKSIQKDDERLPKYVESLEDMLQDTKNINDEFLSTYQRRVASIKSELGITTNKYAESEISSEDIRAELLGVRHRSGQKGLDGVDDLDQVMQHHENMQSKITDHMLSLTQSLKEQSELANKIIKKDTEAVGESAKLSERSHNKLAVESNKLTEHTKRACRCWMWIMLLVVMVVFINMVLFMKVMKKKY